MGLCKGFVGEKALFLEQKLFVIMQIKPHVITIKPIFENLRD